jgi:putative ABC transport system substrate-binding protein
MPVVGYLTRLSLTWPLAGLRKGISETGYVVGQDVTIEYASADGDPDRLPNLATDVVRRGVKVIIAAGSEAIDAAKAATATVPIVFTTGIDPVELGLIASFNHPGGNLTGVAAQDFELAAKRLELLHQLAPAAKTIAMFHDITPSIALAETRDLRSAASILGVRLLMLHPLTATEVEQAFDTLVEQGAGGLLICSCTDVFANIQQIISLAATHAIPTMLPFSWSVAAGGLASYSFDPTEVQYLAGLYVGRILKCDKPADLPVIQPTRSEFVINLKTAKMLGLTVPPTLLALTNRVIE